MQSCNVGPNLAHSSNLTRCPQLGHAAFQDFWLQGLPVFSWLLQLDNLLWHSYEIESPLWQSRWGRTAACSRLSASTPALWLLC